MNTQQASQTLVTHIARPYDSKCKWWQAEIPQNLSVANLEDERLVLKYYKSGQDLELPVGKLLIDSEQNHHRRNRGFSVQIGLVTENGLDWLMPSLEIKKFIKSKGHIDLMKGSGEVAAVFRIALYLRRQENIFESFNEIKSI
jgi:hypothetical protein